MDGGKSPSWMTQTRAQERADSQGVMGMISGAGIIIAVVSIVFLIIFLITGFANDTTGWSWEQITTFSPVWKAFLSGVIIAIIGFGLS